MNVSKTLADSIKFIGRSMPVGMEVFFFRDPGSTGAGMTINEPGGKFTEYRFLHSDPLSTFAVREMEREMELEQAVRDLIAMIRLSAQCVDGETYADCKQLGPLVEAVETLLADGWEPDDSHPADRIDRQMATISYPTGSLGEAVDGWFEWAACYEQLKGDAI